MSCYKDGISKVNVLAGVNLQGKIGVQLLLRDVPEGLPLSALNDPFLTLPNPDPINRWFAGRLVTDTGNSLKLLTLVILRDDIIPGMAGITNGQVEEMWNQEWDAMLRLGEEGPGILPLAPYTAPDGSPKKHKPLFYCKQARQLFMPPCPRCGQTLTECRNDDVLLQAGLMPFTQGLRRYLWCEDCQVSHKHSPVFFVKDLSRAENVNPMVADLTGLIRQWSDLSDSISDQAGFPCTSCPEYTRCYQGVEEGHLQAEEFVTPLSFYDFFMLIRDFLPLDIAAASDLIGGCPSEKLLEQAKSARNPVQEEAVSQFIHRGHPLLDESKKYLDARRCIQAKLKLWFQAIEQVRQVWSSYQRPLLSLAPEAFYVDCPVPSYGYAPEFQLRAYLCMCSRAISVTIGQDVEVTSPACVLNQKYMLPDLSGSEGVRRGQFLMDSCHPTQVPGQYLVSGYLNQAVTAGRILSKASRILISLSYAQGFGRDIQVCFHSVGQGGQKLMIQSEALQLSEEEASLINLLATQPAFDVDYQLVAVASVAADLFSLGLIGARLLSVNERQGLDSVLRSVLDIRTRILEGEDFAGSQDQEVWFQEVLKAEPVFAPENLFYRGQSVDGLKQFHELWAKVLRFMFNMIAASPKFGYDLQSADGAEILKAVEKDLKALIGQADVQWTVSDTYHIGPRDEKLASLLDEILSDPEWSMKSPTLKQEKIWKDRTEVLQTDKELPGRTAQGIGEGEETIVLKKGEIPLSRERESEQELEETLIMSAEKIKSLGEKQRPESREHLDQGDPEETVILTSNHNGS
jgi:hypothetical protein